MRSASRYDGHAQWYDEWRAAHVGGNAAEIAELLGPGDGLCLDLGCGTGLLFPALAGTGRTAVGLDVSADQLRFARRRSRQVIQADGATLPFRCGVFAAVVASWISTDVDDFSAVLAEATRVLEPGGTFLTYGAHPCFNGPHIEWLADGGVRAHPTYRDAGWHAESPWWGVNVRKRVGMRHTPLAEILNAFIAMGLAIEHIAESGTRPVPNTLAIRARKPLTLRIPASPRATSPPPAPGIPANIAADRRANPTPLLCILAGGINHHKTPDFLFLGTQSSGLSGSRGGRGAGVHRRRPRRITGISCGHQVT
jgi:SAM-dependent methyltransferase